MRGLAITPRCEFKFLASIALSANTSHSRNVNARNQESVLILNIEPVEGPDRVSIPSLVRLYGIHDELDDVFGGIMFQSTIHGTFKSIPGFVDGKFCVFRPLANDIVHGEIKRGSKIMQCVSDDEGKLLWNGFHRNDLDNIASSLRVMLDVDTVRVVCVSKLPHATIKVIDVMLGPFNL